MHGANPPYPSTKRLRNPSRFKIQKRIQKRTSQIIFRSPQITSEYKILLNLIDLLNGLYVKWKIVSIKHYDYRVIGRCLNINFLDLEEMNSKFMTTDIIWISSKILVPPLDAIASPSAA